MNFSKPKKIFIVDDDAMFSEALRDYLTRDTPHQIRTFSTGEACLNNLNDNPDIVILDFYLDSVQKDAANGMEILQNIKHNYPDMKVIMLSSQESYATALNTIKQGALNYVSKGEKAFEQIENMVARMWFLTTV